MSTTQKITEAFEIIVSDAACWVVRREDGKYAVANDSDVTVDMDDIDAVACNTDGSFVEGTWHDSLHSLRLQIRESLGIE